MTHPVEDLLLTALARGFEQAFHLFYGIYRAEVVDNKDDTGRGKILVHIHGIGSPAPTDIWVEPMTHAGPDRGWFFPPDVGDWVWIMFDKGNPSKPLAYLLAGYAVGEVPAEFTGTDDFTPARKGIVTRLGHSLIFNDEPGEESISLTWHKPAAGDAALADPTVSADRTSGTFSTLTFSKDGGITILANSGKFVLSYEPTKGADKAQFMIMDGDNGNSITLGEDGCLFMDKDGNNFGLQKGKFVVIADKGITFTGQGASFSTGGASLGFPAPMSGVCGEPLMAWLGTHMHTATGPTAPTTPPVVPPPPAILSQSVKLKA